MPLSPARSFLRKSSMLDALGEVSPIPVITILWFCMIIKGSQVIRKSVCKLFINNTRITKYVVTCSFRQGQKIVKRCCAARIRNQTIFFISLTGKSVRVCELDGMRCSMVSRTIQTRNHVF